MSEEKHIQRIIECHEREAEDEYHRRVGDDPVYDQITWDNIEPFLPKRGWRARAKVQLYIERLHWSL